MSEPKVFLLPDLGEGLTEAELVSWLVAVGDEIRVDQPIAEVETAKSMVEVPSPYAGTVAVLHGEPGQTLDVGKPLISVTPVGAAGAAAPPQAMPPPGGARRGRRMMPPPPLRRTALSCNDAVRLRQARCHSRGGIACVGRVAGDSPSAGVARLLLLPRLLAVAAEVYREEEKAGSGNVLIGYGTPGGHGVARRTRAPKRAAAWPSRWPRCLRRRRLPMTCC